MQALRRLGGRRGSTEQGGTFLGSLGDKASATSDWDLAHHGLHQDKVLKRCQLKRSTWTQPGVCIRSCLACGTAAIAGRARTSPAMRSAMRTGLTRPSMRPAVRKASGQACSRSNSMQSSSTMSSTVEAILFSSCLGDADAMTQQLSRGLVVKLRSSTEVCSPSTASLLTSLLSGNRLQASSLKHILNGTEDAHDTLKVPQEIPQLPQLAMNLPFRSSPSFDDELRG